MNATQKLTLGHSFPLAELGSLPTPLQTAARVWLSDNFGPETDFACEVKELPDGGLSIVDVGGDTDSNDFAIHELVDEGGKRALVAVLFTPMGEGCLFDLEGNVVALAIEGHLREVDPKYDDAAPQWSRLLPGIVELSDTPPATAVASPLVGPKSEAEWRALFPTPAAQRTIDVIVERLRKARHSGGSYNHSQFAHDTKVPLKRQPQDSFEWLAAAKMLFLTHADPFDNLILEDITPLGVFVGLSGLKLCVGATTDLSALAQLTQLRTLTITGGEQSDWGWLGALQLLEELDINKGDGATEVPRFGIQNNPKLRKLVWFGDFSDLSPLGSNNSLQTLQLQGNVVDLSPLRGFPLLDELDVSWNDVSDISPLLDLKNLQLLEISKNRVTSLEGIEGLPQLFRLNAEWNCISDFAPVERWLLADPDRDADWIEEHAPTQLDLTSPAGQAVKDDWYNLDKWRALAEQLLEQGHPLAEEVQLRLANDGDCSLPFRWGRDSNIPSDDWE